ncbi:MAG TPA: hypothetical protein VIF10_10545 [Methylobacter sp.]
MEASSFNKTSYPIEIAWSDSGGAIETHLINPDGIQDWTDWDFHAEQIHGISRQLCRESGVHPKSLCRRMSQSIAPGELIYADGGQYDQDWIDVLYGAGSKLGFSQFKVIHSDSIMLPLLSSTESDSGKRWQLYEKLKADARKKVGGQHRAALDVQYLIELFLLCTAVSRQCREKAS